MPVVLWDTKVGDSAPVVRVQLRHRPTVGQRYGSPVNLSAATQVTATARREWDQVLVASGNAVVSDAATGLVAFVMAPPVASQAGLVAIEFTVTWADLTQQTWPAESMTDFWYLRVRGDLGASPIAVEPCGTALAPLFVAAGATGFVSYNGQHVFAGPGATLMVAPTVTTFSLAAHPGEPAWGPATVPTLSQAGTTLHATTYARLAASEGDEVTLARSGSVWFGTAPAATGGSAVDEEIGEGAALPPDGSIWELFRLQGHPTLADGLYRWDYLALAWIAVG